MTKKDLIYTDEILAKMKDAYIAADDSDEARSAIVEELAEDINQPIRSIISKLVGLNVYIAKTRKNKSGSPIRTKAQLVDDFIKVLEIDLTESEASSLEKATKNTLVKLIASVTKSVETEEEQNPRIINEEAA